MNSLSALHRAETLHRLEHEIFDLVIIGGGINGAGVARDAASRGMKVALIEGRDYACGTSSKSSKLVHGGIRYLENLEFGLVFEALSERRLLFQLAPHLVHPLRFVIPVYKGGRVPPWKMGLGMFLYDALALFETPEPAEKLSPAAVAEDLPQLQQQDLQAAFAYSDAYMDDDRLVIETLRSAVKMGAVCANYINAEGADFDDGKLCAIKSVDQRSKREISIRGRHFVSTVGPWTDLVAPKILGEWQPRMRPSKGVHITFSRERFPLKEAVVMGAEKRIVFAIPRHEMVIVGTTDTDYQDDPYNVHTDQSDVTYLMNVVAKYFPGARLERGDILASYSGVRPLVKDHSLSESQTSREHQILSDARNMTFVMGGKYTTYRRIAEQTVEACLANFSWEDQVRFGQNQTKVALNEKVTAESYAERDLAVTRLAKKYPRFADVAAQLFDRHGPEAGNLIQLYSEKIGGHCSGQDALWAMEARHAIEQTGCLTIGDFFLRRTPLVLCQGDHGAKFIPAVKDQFANLLGLTSEQLEAQIEDLKMSLKNEFAWRA